MRKALDRLYTASGWLAAAAMVAVLILVLLTSLSRLLGMAMPGTDSYAGYAMAGSGFLALASTLKKGEHIRVTLVLGLLKGKLLKGFELTALAIGVLLSGFLAFYSARLVWQSWLFQDISVGIDATPLWLPQILMALGTLVFFLALLDEFFIKLLDGSGSSRPPQPE